VSDLPSGPRLLPELIAGRYQRVAQLGVGGMGMVYKATDTRLGRAVAIKAIHDRRLLDRDAAQRLRAEALAAASLDHPYICKVYELVEDAGETFLVMEFVEGETLSSILRNGPPPLDQTLRIGREIAEGLAAAHARGLVHRDIKPSNVMITPHGHVKLLDFGLARADMETAPLEATRTSPASGTAYAGTPNYMSPEQATGAPVTSRADLFSLGVVLFECLSGRLPFPGTSAYDYVRHLLSDDPRPLYRLAPQAPADLVKVIDRCLEKVPANRPESAAVVVGELQRIADAMTTSSRVFRTAQQARARRTWTFVAAGLVVAVAAGLALWQQFGNRPAATSTLQQSRPFVSWPSEEFDSRIAPDGEWVSFLSNRGGATALYVQRADGNEPRAVTLSSGRPVSHLWSPDGRELACLLAQGSERVLHVVPAFFGGETRQRIVIDPKPSYIRLLRWIGRTIFYETGQPGSALHRVDLDSGVAVNLSAAWKVDGALRGFDVHPDGTRVVYSLLVNGEESLWTAGIDGRSPVQLTDDAYFARAPLWRGGGQTILYRSNRGGQTDLWEIDPATRQSWPLTASQTQESPESSSIDGTRVTFQQEDEDAKLWLLDPAGGRSRPLTRGTLNDMSPVSSADGRMLAFQRSQPTPSQGSLIVDSALFVVAVNATGFAEEPRKVADGFAPSLSPDGSALAFLQHGPGTAETTLGVKRLRTGETVTVSANCPIPIASMFPVDWVSRTFAWSADGADLFFVDQGDGLSLRRYRLDARAPASTLLTVPGGVLRDPYPSPDGRTLAFVTWTDQTYVLHALDLASGQDRELARFAGSSTSLYLRGWLDGNGGLALVQSEAIYDEIGSSDVAIIVITPAGEVRRVASVARGFIGTTRLAPAQQAMFITQSKDGVHNLQAVSIRTGAFRPVTDNTLQSVTVSGLTLGPRDTHFLIGVRDERTKDVWMSEIRPAGPPRR